MKIRKVCKAKRKMKAVLFFTKIMKRTSSILWMLPEADDNGKKQHQNHQGRDNYWNHQSYVLIKWHIRLPLTESWRRSGSYEWTTSNMWNNNTLYDSNIALEDKILKSKRGLMVSESPFISDVFENKWLLVQ